MEGQAGGSALIRGNRPRFRRSSGPWRSCAARSQAFGTFACAGNFCTVNCFHKMFYVTQGEEFSQGLFWNSNCGPNTWRCHLKNRNYSLLPSALILAAALYLPGCSGNGSNANSANSGQPASSSAGGSAVEARQSVTIPAGTELHVILGTAIDSGTSQSGDSFQGTLSQPILVGGGVVVPRDARVRGTVVEARSSGRLSKPAFLSVAITAVEADGSWVNVNTHPVTLEGKSHKKRDVVAIGGGSALGALIGGIAGGGKGAAIGAGAGAGAGTAGAALTGKKEISLPAESRLIFRLSRAATVRAR